MPEVSQICELYHVEDYGSKINYSLAVKKYQPEKKAAIVSDIFSTVLYIIGEDGIDAEKIEEIRQSVSAKSYIDDETWDMVEKAFRGVVVGVNAAVAADYYGNVGKVENSYGKSSLIELKNTNNFMDSTIEHIFEGNVRRGNAGGYHYECIKDTAGNVVSGTEVSLNDLGVYKAQVEVNCIPQTGNGGYSTFFPKDMSPQDVIDSINEAYNNRVFVVGTRNSYIGVSNSGLEIEMYINNNGKIISAFPKE